MNKLDVLVNKLGHELEEIRSRALLTIISKLEYGLITESQLADRDNLFTNLIKGLSFKNVQFRKDVLKLIFRVLKNSENSAGLLLRADPGLAELRKTVDCEVLVQDIVNLTSKQVNSAKYNKNSSNASNKTTLNTATVSNSSKSIPITKGSKALVQKPCGSTNSCLQSAPRLKSYNLNHNGQQLVPTKTDESDARISDRVQDTGESVIWALPMIRLVGSDLHVLSMVEDSLSDVSSAPYTCHLFTTVIINDFPPEVFLQRPTVLKQIWKLMKKSSPLNEVSVESLLVFTNKLHSRMLHNSRLELATNKQQEIRLTLEPLSTPQFCLVTLICAMELVGRVQLSSTSVLKTLKLFKAVVPEVGIIWQHKPRTRTSTVHDLAQCLLQVLTKLIKQSVSFEPLVELHVIALSLKIVECLVPEDLALSVLPIELQEIICFSLVDPVLVINYPSLHRIALKYAKVLKCEGLMVYQEVSKVLEGMEASVKFFSKPSFEVFRTAIVALPFHQELDCIKAFTQFMLERCELNDEDVHEGAVLLRALLAHTEKAVVAEAYMLCHDIILSSLGPCQALKDLDPWPSLRFIINTSVLVEIVCHGVTSADSQTRQHAEDMVLYMVKCQRLLPEQSWCRVVEQLVPILPLLQCHASKSTPLGRALIAMLDPDTTTLASNQVVSGNCRLLFHKDPLCREEAATRLLWLTRLSHLPHKKLVDVYLIDSSVTSHTPIAGMYEVGSVVRVLEVLSGPCVEARVQQSALTQLSVMMEDPSLHKIFIEQDGVQIFTELLKTTAMDVNEGSSVTVIPVISTLKHLTRHNTSIRQSLANDEQLILDVLRCTFQLAEWRVQRDAAQLLALLLYTDFILSSAISLSLPKLCVQTLLLPFPCQAHWAVSPNMTTPLKGVVMSKMGVSRLLALKWLVSKEGLEEVLQMADVPPEFSQVLRVSLQAVRQIQKSHVSHNCKLLLYNFQNATSHGDASSALRDLTRYLELHWLLDPRPLNSLPWKTTFSRFLLTLPSSPEDFLLLCMVLNFLKFLLGVSSGQFMWVAEALQTPPYTLMKFITSSNVSQESCDQEMWKNISLSTMELCKMCLRSGCDKGWGELVQLILQSLGPSRNHHHNLGRSHPWEDISIALLDSKLEFLLSAVTEETDSRPLWRLLAAFHCEAPQSHMGLSITRHNLWCLNKLLSVTQEWERKMLSEPYLRWLPEMIASGDVLVRASALQLLSGLARSVRGAGTVLQLRDSLFDSILAIVIDHSEASLVREQAAALLTNIVKFSPSKDYLLSAQRVNLCREVRNCVQLVAMPPVSNHTDSDSGMLYTHPRLVRATCYLVYNLVVSAKDEIMSELVVSSSLAASLSGLLSHTHTLVSAEAVHMSAAGVQLLAQVCGGCQPAFLHQMFPTVATLLDPAVIAYASGDITVEVKSLWKESLRLLRAILSQCGTECALPSTLVMTLCQCITDTSSTTMMTSTLWAVPAVTKSLTPGAQVEVCEALMSLWWTFPEGKIRSAVTVALTSLLSDSDTATECAVRAGLWPSMIMGLHQLHLTLTLQTTSTDKLKKNCRSMEELQQKLALVSSVLVDSVESKEIATQHGLADVIHKVWVWCHVDIQYLLLALDLLITFTADCPYAAHSLVLTSTLSGLGQRKSPTSNSMVHAVVSLLTKERHPGSVYIKAFTLLSHSCQAQECRNIITKSSLLVKWSDLWASRKPLQEEVELHWLMFIQVFSYFQEGQVSIPKTADLFNQLIECAENRRVPCRALAVTVLRNLSALASNKPRFLSTRSSLVLIGEKLLSGTDQEKCDAALIVWALAANNHKAKIVLRGLGIVNRLQLAAATSNHNIYSSVADILQPS